MSVRAPRPPVGPPTFLTASRRERDLEELAAGLVLDVIVVGGGVTGAGAALDAASRGLSVALLERRDLASGTSGQSSKLVHGGLRYLVGGHFGVAWQSACERARLASAIAPHLVRPLPQLVPLFGEHASPIAAALEVGFRIGDAMRALTGLSRRELPSMRRVGAVEAGSWSPALRGERLRGAILSWDGQLEDDARLVVALARTAAAHGARVLTYAEATELSGDGVRARDVIGGADFDVRARHVINATGVWADRLVAGTKVRPSKGSHLVVRAERLGSPRAMLNVPVPGRFGRFVFAVPCPDDLVLIGVTDDPLDGACCDAPPVSAAEESYLLDTISGALARPLTSEDVIGRFAGLRPLLDSGVGDTADLSRSHAVIEDPASGAVTVVGGKLTTYRRMAQDAIDVLAARSGVVAGPCRTATLPLVGARPPASPTEGVPARLARRFGAEAPEITALADGQSELLEPITPDIPVLGVELIAAVEREGALTLEDVIDRRTRLGLVDAWRAEAYAAAQRILPTLAGVHS